MADSATQAADSMPWLSAYPAHVDWAAPIQVGPIQELLDRAVASYSGHRALDFLDKTYTYAEIGALSDRFAKGLQELGLARGERVGLFLPNTPYYVIAFFGILKAGGTVVNFNPLYAKREVKHQIEDSGIRFMVTLDLDMLYGTLFELMNDTPMERLIICPMRDVLPVGKKILFTVAKRKEVADIEDDERHVFFTEITANDGRYERRPCDPVEDIAVLQYTGGTTGIPKGAMLTHANIRANTEQCRLWFPNPEPGNERILCVLPFFHVFAMTTAMNLGLSVGAELIVLPRFDIKSVLKAIHQKKVTLFPAVPTIYTAINNFPQRNKYDLSSIRYCISGGAPLPVDVGRTFESLTGCKLVEGYGLSETAPVATINPLDGSARSGSIGLPVPGTRIEIVSVEDRETLMKQGERGEICVVGPQVMKGYFNMPAETAEVLRDGRLHTGDVGYMDEQGFTFIVDRMKDMIIAGGYNIYPRNVEEQIYTHEAVEEVVVAGIPRLS
jgi:long-chain acyl-CoA synthetase